VVALSLATLAAIRSEGESSYLDDLSWVSGPDEPDADADAAAAADFQRQRFQNHIRAAFGYYLRRSW